MDDATALMEAEKFTQGNVACGGGGGAWSATKSV